MDTNGIKLPTGPHVSSQFIDGMRECVNYDVATTAPAIEKEASGDNVFIDARIREIFLANGFTIKDGQTDLKPYVYKAAYALLRAVGVPVHLHNDPGHWNGKEYDSAASAEPASACDPGDLCAGCRCRYNTYADVAQPAPPAPAQSGTCAHRIVDARNKFVQSGYLCIDCGAVFAAVHTSVAPAPSEEPVAYWWNDIAKGGTLQKAIGFQAPPFIATGSLNPLYDHPATQTAEVRAMTDEEILDFAHKNGFNPSMDEVTRALLLPFARALLEQNP